MTVRARSQEAGEGDVAPEEGERRNGFTSERRSLDLLLVPFSVRCMNASFDQLDREIEQGLHEINTFFNSDRVLLWEFSEDGEQAQLTHFYAEAGADPPMSSLMHETLPYIFGSIRDLRNLCVSGLDDLPQDALIDRQYLERHGIRSFMVVPLMVGGTLRGALSLVCIKTKRAWSNEDLFNAQRIGTVLAGALDRERSHHLLERRMQFETLITDLSARLIKAPMNEVDGEIERALEQVREIFQASSCGFLGIRADRRFCWVTHASYGEGVEPVSGDINLADLFPWPMSGLSFRATRSISPYGRTAGGGRDRAQNHGRHGHPVRAEHPLFVEGRVAAIIFSTPYTGSAPGLRSIFRGCSCWGRYSSARWSAGRPNRP